MGPVVLDTGVIVALLNPADAHHRKVSERLSDLLGRGGRFVLSAVSLAELLSSKDRLHRERAGELVDALGEGALIPVGREVAEFAGELRRSRPSLRTPDAMVAATARFVDADLLLTTDRSLARVDGAEYVGVSRR